MVYCVYLLESPRLSNSNANTQHIFKSKCSSFVFSMLIFSNLAVSNGFLADFCPLRNGSVLAASILILYLLEIY